MNRGWIHLALAGLLVACSLPILAISFVIAALGAGLAAMIPRKRKRKRARAIDVQKTWAADEFAFDRAIESYEALIDAQAWRRK